MRCSRVLGNSRTDKAAFSEAISRGKTGKTHRGVPHSEKTRRHLSEISKGGKRAGANNGMFGRAHSKESRDAMSATRTARIVAGDYDLRKWAKKGNVWSEKAQRDIPYRSTWEKRVVEILESDETVISFKFEPFRIPYYLEGSTRDFKRYYVPDFLVEYSDGSKVLVEVKPECFVGAAMNVAKFAAAREYCEREGWAFEVWTQKKLAGLI